MNPSIAPRLPSEIPEKLRVLRREEYASWMRDGYIVVKNAVPRALAESIGREILEFTGADPSEPDTWPRESVLGMVSMVVSPGQWAARTHSRLQQAISDLWGQEAVEVTPNRSNCNIPVSDSFKRDDVLHWDLYIDREDLNPSIQMTLALSDAGEDDGTFVCAPGTHHLVQEWREQGMPGIRPEPEDFLKREDVHMVKVPVQAGDLVAWRMDLLHGNGANRGGRVRLATYISAGPAGCVRTNGAGNELRSEVCRLNTIDSWELSPWLPALANALGSTQAAVESWASAQCDENDQQPAPPLPFGETGLLNSSQRESIIDILKSLPPTPSRPNLDGKAQSGAAASTVRTLLYCRDACRLITAHTGVEIPVADPPELDMLGKKIIGLHSW